MDYNLPASRLQFGCIPFGTGNDFARHAGWGDLLDVELEECLIAFERAREGAVDLWAVRVEVAEGGRFEENWRVEGRNEERVVGGTALERVFLNYLSFGMDARVSYEFERNRVSCACCNLFCYCLLGLKNFFKPIARLSNLLQALLVKGQPVAFPADNLHLLFLNISSYMGGVRDIWRHVSGRRPGFEPSRGDDGVIEAVSFSSELALGLERFCRGQPVPVMQGEGPIQILFKEQAADIPTYLQMDG
jgi:diacylglycerol kinase (ATP)